MATRNKDPELRAWAEARLKARPDKSSSNLQQTDLPRLLHELQVHQIELEMQNEELQQAQAELEESRDRYVDLYDFAPVGYVTLAGTGLISEINIAGALLLGVERNQLSQRRFAQFIAQEDNDRWQQHFLRALQHGERQHCELAIRRSDGSRIYAALDCIRSAIEGVAPSVHIILTDITVRKQAEQKLRTSYAEIEDLYNNAPCGYHSLDRDGVFHRINDTELAWLGYSRDEVAEKMKITDLMPPASQEIFRENYPQFMKRGFVHNLEFELIRKDGTVLSALVSATAIYDPGGEYVMSRSTVQDISKRKRAQEELRIAAIAFESQEAIMVTDASGVILRVNQAFTRLTGYSAKEAIGNTPAMLKSGLQDEMFYRRLWQTLKQNRFWQGEMWNKRKDGSIYVEFQTISAVVAPDGSVSHYIGSFLDISEQKRLERELVQRREEMEELQKLHVAAQTAAAIAHELNQPLLAIASYSGGALMLLNAKKPNLDKIREAVAASEVQAQRAGRSIHELLELLSTKEFPTDVFDLNREIVELLDAARAEHELQFKSELNLEHGLPPVQANRIHVQKVLMNLLRNAIEAMHEAGVPRPAIIVTVRTIKDKNLAQLTIRDNGPGLRDADIQNLFHPFFTTKTKGIGMGLSISRSLIEANGGQLWVDPQEGPGATFHLTLPLAS